jgi:CheY-like chemotaxis protein
MVIKVQDTGAGIAPEQLPHIFDRFWQVDGSTTRSHGGLGLGLAIVRHLIEAHGGTVSAASEGLGRGTTVQVNLPIRAVAPTASGAHGQPLADEDAKTGAEARATPHREAAGSVEMLLQAVSVLVVDDDADSLEVIRNVLEQAGASVTCATTAREALEVLQRAHGIEIVISDIGMPETDGYGFMRKLRTFEEAAALPAIALTAYARTEDAARARRAGFQEHFAKPIDEQQLLKAIRRLSRLGSADLQ